MNYTELALETWYKKDNPLYHNPEPAVLGLCGEIGEVIDQWKKHQYKPNRRASRNEMLEERGDIWWYYRIVAWLYGYNIDRLLDATKSIKTGHNTQLECQSIMMTRAAAILHSYLKMEPPNRIDMIFLLAALVESVLLLDSDIDELTRLNYEKLTDGNGWNEAR